MNRGIASLSLDLDNQWSYMKTHGDAGWETFPSYLDLVVPRTLKFLCELDLKITFFIVGQDAALEKNTDAIRQIHEAGHEIGNHSFNHEPWLHLYTRDELEREFEMTEASIESIIGTRPVGFRGPGYSLSSTVLDVLVERGYRFDCSLLPTYIGPLARTYYFLKAGEMSEEEKTKRKKLFGKFSDGLQSLTPSVIEINGSTLVEIPVTTFPGIKIPIHFSYIIYLATFSRAAARTYWKAALRTCRAAGIQPSLLLHPLDFMGGSDAAELKFFPGMSFEADEKIDFLSGLVSTYTDLFEVLSMERHAQRVLQTKAADR